MPKTRLLVLAAVFFMAFPLAALAYNIRSGSSISVSKDQPVDGNLYAFGQTIAVDADVKGDVICAGQAITINGNVEGSVLCAGQTITVNGKIDGSAGIAGDSITINNTINRSLNVFAASLVFAEKASTGWDLMVMAGKAELRGDIGRDLYGRLEEARIFGKIGRNVELNLGDNMQQTPLSERGLAVEESAEINGNLEYTAVKDAIIKEGAVVKGETVKKQPKSREREPVMAWARGKVYSIFAALIIGLALVSLWRVPVEKITDLMLEKAGATIGWGLLVLILTPVLAALLAITIIGFPLAIAIMCLWAVLLTASKVIAAILVGRSLVERFWATKKTSIIWAMIIGIIVLYIVFAIPIVGPLVAFAAMVWGVGAPFLYLKQKAMK